MTNERLIADLQRMRDGMWGVDLHKSEVERRATLDAAIAQLEALYAENLSLKAWPDEDEAAQEAKILEEIYSWTGSAYLAGEEVGSIEGQRKADLYSFLCRLIGWFTPSSDPRSRNRLAWAYKIRREEARAAKSQLEALREALRTAAEAATL